MIPISSSVRTMRIIGDAWTLLILQNAFRGARRYGDWADILQIPNSVLTDRLNRLLEAGILRKETYREHPVRYEYRLTEKGRDLWQYLLAIWDWERRWVRGAAKRLRKMVHHPCNTVSNSVLSCAHCGEPIHHNNVIERPGPGRGLEPRIVPRWQRRTVKDKLSSGDETAHYETWRILGDRWTTVLIYVLGSGLSRFNELHKSLGISPYLLSERLAALEGFGVVTTKAYSQKPVRHDYTLTAKGWALYQARMLAMAWGDRWLAGEAGPPLVLTHTVCGQRMIPELRCSTCSQPLRQGEFHFKPCLTLFKRK